MPMSMAAGATLARGGSESRFRLARWSGCAGAELAKLGQIASVQGTERPANGLPRRRSASEGVLRPRPRVRSTPGGAVGALAPVRRGDSTEITEVIGRRVL